MGAALLAALSASAGNDVVVKAGDTVKLFTETKAISKTYDFEDATLQGWASIDADGDGHNWRTTYDFSEDMGRNSEHCVISESFYSDGIKREALKPNNYLVSPMKVKVGKSTFISFYAAAYDKTYSKEHFGVAISKGDDRMNPNDYATIAEWTYGVNGVATQLKGKDISSVKRQPENDWVLYTVDLSKYADEEIWVAIRHFNCTEQDMICVDDITISNYLSYCSWTNDSGVIGLPKKGEGPVEFVATNDASGNDIVANITTQYGDNKDSFTLTVQPMDATIAPVEDITVKDGEQVEVFLTVDEGLLVLTKNDNPSIWTTTTLYHQGYINFTAVNKTKEDQVANITSIPYKRVTDEGGKAYGHPMTFKVTVKSSMQNDIVVNAGELVSLFPDDVESKTYDFEDGTLQGWTTIDEDGDGYSWQHSRFIFYGGPEGHDSEYCVYDGFGGVYDNYLVSPMKVKAVKDTYISFYVSGFNNSFILEHFGVAVSTTGNTDVKDFETIADWTYAEEVGKWKEYKVDLSQYAGDEIWVAIRHYNCNSNSYISVDDITIGNYFVGCTWTCDNPAIGMAASGSGRTEFFAQNDVSGNDVVAKVSVKPLVDEEYSFDITVKPLDAVVAPVDDVKAKDGDKVDVALTVDDGLSVEWTNDNPAVGLAASGEGDISFAAVNKNKEDQVANIMVIPFKPAGDGKAYGKASTFKITVSYQESGLTEISADDTSDALFFTVSGIQVPADRLLPGIYLRRSAGKTDKVIVK